MRPDDMFTIQRWPRQLCVIVWDPRGWQDAGGYAFLTCWAWQDVSSRILRRWARQLAEAWTGLRLMGDEWPAATPEIWTAWATSRLDRPMDPEALVQRIETLYQFYAFWHWYDPTRVRQQPWPRDRRERIRGLALIAYS